jgi:hypothetical protein
MKSLILVLALKIASAVGACMNTVGFLTFFFWPTLAAYRWHLILGGFALIAVAEIAARWVTKRAAAQQVQGP